ncbi:MAG: alpha-galactosidase [Bacteroidetes bacterium GWF2_42_66]|nr:MAG: alpha-galactosidase [Bacteroidetes bacterium GWA2_42_15]OFY01908.1 MAG: alpha-galactosidase [Bacteroidetes bacterium GWE2_42_39]OFY44796.1 MAG: alpha-galactosidase [Bacteroidetes bacterium GWF2_42_66]HBL75923.1 alpha-galactosidase [Prolixibacteraceae bacterium]HCR89170.1 alpha-galactosidase [Prolixibacteraceae bacterium]
MKRLFLLICIIPIICGISSGQKTTVVPETQNDVRQWVGQHFAKGKIPPFSFVYGGRSSNDFIKNWQFSAEKIKTTEPDSEVNIFTYSDKSSGLTIKCTVSSFSDFPAVEWVLNFTNTSGKNSPTIEKLAVIDHSFTSDENGTFILHHAKGSNAERSDFQPIDDKMQAGKNIYMTPSHGRSSDNTAFPFFNIEMPGKQGIMVAVGWTGKWYADVLQTGEKSVSLKSGMEKMQLKLYPKEEIRTPKICLLFWKGNDRMIGHNQFRRFILAHHTRKINGQFAEYPLSGSFDYGDPAPCGEYECLTEEFAVALVKRYQQFRILPEVFWLDAGWYTGCGGDKEKGGWWQNVGNWSVERERFPNGLKPVADAVHSTGSKFMVWFEPERVRPETQIDKDYPEWLIKLPKNENFLFNLGNKEARIWMTNRISDLIKSEGIDYYRQDFNFDPMPYWEANDKPGRIGISEIRHIEGLYAFWDSLLVRFPKLLIDNCASGGRRIDLEMTSRSAPLWRTDYQYGEPNGYQCHTFGLNFYLPIHGTAIYKTDRYTFRSGLGATAVLNWEVTGKNGESIPAIQKKIQEYKNLRPYFYGDYYPLTQSSTRDNAWLAYQLNRPEQKDGIIIVFRRGDCNSESIMTKLHGLDENATYELFYEDYGVTVKKTGRELMAELNLTIPQKPASLLISYKITD